MQIGSLVNVPSPGDPITSPWSQDVSRLVVHHFASRTARDLWTPPPKGAVCTTEDCPNVLQWWAGTRWLASQAGYQVVNTDVNGRAGFAYPYAFKATPNVTATSAGETGVLVVVGRTATAGANSNVNCFLHFWGVHFNPPRAYASSAIDVSWTATGEF